MIYSNVVKIVDIILILLIFKNAIKLINNSNEEIENELLFKSSFLIFANMFVTIKYFFDCWV